MDLNDPTHFRTRFLAVPSHAPPHQNPPDDYDLIEDDVVFDNNDDSTQPSSSSPIPNYHHKGFGFGSSDAFGILAALPDNEHLNGSHCFHHKPSVSVSFSSSRPIPAIPKLPPDRTPSSSLKLHQSAPVNVPILPPRRWRREFDDDDNDDNDDGDIGDTEEMLPPHELVAQNSMQSPALACSVLEGVGRTLKGRDLRQVRNAVWRQTGFLD